MANTGKGTVVELLRRDRTWVKIKVISGDGTDAYPYVATSHPEIYEDIEKTSKNQDDILDRLDSYDNDMKDLKESVEGLNESIKGQIDSLIEPLSKTVERVDEQLNPEDPRETDWRDVIRIIDRIKHINKKFWTGIGAAVLLSQSHWLKEIITK